jgi:hypothetical protein
MAMAGYVDYQAREYCRDIQCPVQLELNSLAAGSADYERVRAQCRTGCRHTTWEFHRWLIEHGYEVVRPQK